MAKLGALAKCSAIFKLYLDPVTGPLENDSKKVNQHTYHHGCTTRQMTTDLNNQALF